MKRLFHDLREWKKSIIWLIQRHQLQGKTLYICVSFKNFASDWQDWLVGVPATSWIFLADSQKLSFSTLIMKPISVFWSDKPPRRPSLAQPAWSAKLSRQSRPSLGVDGHDPILKKFKFLRSSWKTVQNMYLPAYSDKKKKFKRGHPYCICKKLCNQHE